MSAREFWASSGHHLAALDARGRMILTPDLARAWLARPELAPPPEACAAERALFGRLKAEPLAPVSPREMASMIDADARENWGFFITMRDALLRAGSIEAGYLALVRGRARLPPVIYGQLVHLILRNALEGCEDPRVLRAGETLFRPQKASLHEGALVLADAEIAEARAAEMKASPLTAMLKGDLDMLGAANLWSYWSRSDAYDFAFPFGADPAAREALARALEAWIRALHGFEARIEPLARLDAPDFRWFVGLTAEGTAIGEALWRGAPPPADAVLAGAFRLELSPAAPVTPEMRDRPVFLLMGLGADHVLRLKPQNLATGLPLVS